MHIQLLLIREEAGDSLVGEDMLSSVQLFHSLVVEYRLAELLEGGQVEYVRPEAGMVPKAALPCFKLDDVRLLKT